MRMNNRKLVNLAAIAIVIAVAYLLKAAGIDIGNLGNNRNADQQSQSGKQAKKSSTPGQFDHYVMALSWSPTYCDSNGRGKGNDEQCAPERNFAFVVHGLWPQYDRGGWPENCAGKDAPWVDDAVINDMRGIMPSKKLIIHEWKKHGTCSHSQPVEYYKAVKQAYSAIRIPDAYQNLDKPLKVTGQQVRDAFLSANSALTDKAIEVTCDNRLREVRICMDKSLAFRSCAKPKAKCRSKEMLLLPSRGG